MTQLESTRADPVLQQRAAGYREADSEFARWATGYGVITHDDTTQVRIHELADQLHRTTGSMDTAGVFRLLAAADRIASAAMWLVVHMTYARKVYTDGRPLMEDDFKRKPEGHTGGSLNKVPAYVGYLAANSLSGMTRSWLMGQGHCVSAIDAVNLLVANMNPGHAGRYDLSDAGLSRFVNDFYAYRVGPDGRPESPLGSHVNAHTARLRDTLFPPTTPARVFLTHTRPEPFIGTVWQLLKHPAATPVLGYHNHGGTLDEQGMLFANRCTWAHVAAAAAALGKQPELLLDAGELDALAGKADPAVLFTAEAPHVP